METDDVKSENLKVGQYLGKSKVELKFYGNWSTHRDENSKEEARKYLLDWKQFMLEYLKLAHRAAKLATGLKTPFCTMRSNGVKVGVYDCFQEHIIILIMPARDNGSFKDFKCPDWTKR